MSDTVLLEIRDGFAVITLNRPEALNAFNTDQCQQLIDVVGSVESRDDVAAVVLTGAGRGFSAGADLQEASIGGVSLQRYLDENYRPSLHAIMNSAKPYVGAVAGPVAGIGIAYMLACDLVVMGESAFMRQPFIDINLIPDGGITWHLAHHLGHQRAFEMVVDGARVSAAQCRDWGLANRIVGDEEVLESACQWAGEMATKPPMALASSKRALRRNISLDFAAGFATEAELQDVLGFAEDTREGVLAFREKRQPKFSGR